MYDQRPFYPLYTLSQGSTAGGLVPSVSIIGSNSAAASAALPGNVFSANADQQIQIANTTTAWAFVNFGNSPANIVAATVAASLPVAPGATRTVTVDSEVSAASVILGAAPGTNTAVIFTRGTGV